MLMAADIMTTGVISVLPDTPVQDVAKLLYTSRISGVPVVDADGRVLGINAQIESTGGGGEGVGFAIPVETVKRSIAQLREQGHVEYAFLGVTTTELYPQLARRLGIGSEEGALVAAVEPGGPADDAGLEPGKKKITFEGQEGVPVGGDAIVAIDGRPIRHSTDLTSIIGLKEQGERVTLEVIRGKRRRTVSATLAERPEKPLPGPDRDDE